jgi:serine/threonine protein kinase
MNLCINPHCQKPQNSNNKLFCQNCGSELLLEGRYRAIQPLGQGGFGKTFEVQDRNGTPKVLKILTNNHPKAVELFQQEAQVLSRLHHPGIPKVEPNDYFIFLPRNSREALHCLVMEKIEGEDLEQWMNQRGNRPINQQVALDWLTQIVEILHQVHQQGIFHRDIKPPNIMLRASGNLALIDFGAVREVSATYVEKLAKQQVTGIASVGYTPPEQMQGQAVPQSDFFALGRTFVYLLTGKQPSDQAMYDARNDELRWRSHAPQVSPQLAEFIDHLMARLANQRPHNTQVILQQLAQIKQALNPSQTRTTPHQSIPPLLNARNVLPPIPALSPQQKSAPGWGFLVLWVLVTFVGAILTFYTIVGGAVLQWLILRKWIYGIGWWWILTTTVGSCVGLVLAGLGVSLDSVNPTVVLFFAAGGALMGGMQWLVLRQRVCDAGSWVLTNIVGACIAGIIPIASALLVGADSATIFAMTFLIGTPTYGVITGRAMMKLLQYPKQPNP